MPFFLVLIALLIGLICGLIILTEGNPFGFVFIAVGILLAAWLCVSGFQETEYIKERITPIVIIKDENGINHRYYVDEDGDMKKADWMGELPEGTMVKIRYSNPWSYGIHWMDVKIDVEPVLEAEGK